MEFVQKLQKIEDIVARNHERLNRQSSSLLNEMSLSSAQKLKESIKDLSDSNRLMRIGIVGRVKAGKSSLINAIAFNGKNILPRAATPMTAALTELNHGDKFAIEVEFFSQADMENIKKDAQAYDEMLETLTQEKLEIISKAKKFLSASKEKKEQEARRRARNDNKLTESVEASSKDQYERMQNSGINIQSLGESKTIVFESLEELQDCLEEYVGSNGTYMPFTRNVKIKFPLADFENVSIIDTPGMNDPVVSREQRTRDELGKCDVIFIVSPAGQFMSAEDLELMDRITQKNGIRELYAVASKVDTQLFGSVVEETKGDFYLALKDVRSTLSQHMKDTLTNLKKSNPEVGNAYDSLIEQSEKSTICTSGIAVSIKENLQDLSKLDETEEHAFKLLKESYPNEFSDQKAAATLDELSKIAELKDILQKVALNKNQIMQEKMDDFVKQKSQCVDDYANNLLKYAQERKKEIESTDIKELEKQQAAIIQVKDNASKDVSLEYENCLNQFEHELRQELIDSLRFKYKQATNAVDAAEGTEERSRTRRVEKSGVGSWFARKLWGGGYEEQTTYYTVTTVRAGAVSAALRDLVDEIRDAVDDKSFEIIQNFRESIPKTLIRTLRRSIAENNGDEELIQIPRLRHIVQSIINNIRTPHLSCQSQPPYESGTLSSGSAESFIKEANDFIRSLQGEVENSIDSHVSSVINNLKAVKISDEIFGEYDKEIEQLKKDLSHHEQTLEELDRIINELQCL